MARRPIPTAIVANRESADTYSRKAPTIPIAIKLARIKKNRTSMTIISLHRQPRGHFTHTEGHFTHMDLPGALIALDRELPLDQKIFVAIKYCVRANRDTFSRGFRERRYYNLDEMERNLQMADKKVLPDNSPFLKTAAEAIGTTLGKLAVRTGVVTPRPAVTKRKKPAPKKGTAASSRKAVKKTSR